MRVGRGFLSPSTVTAGKTQPSKPCAGFSIEVTVRARDQVSGKWLAGGGERGRRGLGDKLLSVLCGAPVL
jgi:hypothetical protein